MTSTSSTAGTLARASLNTATVKHTSLAEAVAAAARAGLGWFGPWREQVAELGAVEVRRIIEGAGLGISSLCRGGFLTAADPKGIAATIEDNTHAIEEAEALGTHELIMVVGGLPARSAPGAGPRPDATAADRDIVAVRARVADRLADLAPIARAHGIRLVLEPLHPIFAADRAVVSTLGQALDLAAPFDADVVGVVVDTYHVWWDPDLRASIARAGAEGRLASYQVCDWNLPLAADALNSRHFVGDGYIDFATITSWVSEAGYRGPIETEIFNEDVWAAPVQETADRVARDLSEFVLPYVS